MLDKLKAGTPFAEVAAADKLKVEWRPGIKRGSTPPGVPAAAQSTEIFRTAEGRRRQRRGTTPAERIVFRVTEIRLPPLDPESAEAKRIDDALRSRIADDLVGAIYRAAADRRRRHHQSERTAARSPAAAA